MTTASGKKKQTFTKTGVGAWTTRLYDREKATGTLKFADDLFFGPNLLHARTVRSTVAHGKILSIETDEALKVPGVVKIVTGHEFPYRFGLYMRDRTPMALDKVRYVGEPVALVVADTEDAAEEGMRKVVVEYEEYPAVLDPVKAATDSSVLVHPELAEYEHVDFIVPQPGTNLGNRFRIRRGDVDQAFAESRYIVEEVVNCPQIAHGFLEPYCTICQQDSTSGQITIWSPAQSVFAVRDILAKGLSYPLNKIRVVGTPVGGGFGGKAGMTIEALCLSAAMSPELKGRPVKLFIPREEVLVASGVRQAYVAKIKMGIDAEGKIIGIKNTFYFDTGISAEYGANPVRSAGYTSTGCYYVPNVWTDSYAVYTNKPFGTAYRGFGLPELIGAMEVVIDIAADKIGMDPLEFRLKNMLRPGLQTCTGMPMHNHALEKIAREVADKIKLNEKEPAKRPGWVRGKGFAFAIKAPAMPADASSSASVKILGDGTVEVLAATMDIGQGAYTAYAQMVSEELGIPIDKINCLYPDTNSHPFDWQTVASRSCWSMGMAVKRAAIDARGKMLALYAEFWGVSPDDITVEEGIVKCASKGIETPIDEHVQYGFKMPDGLYKGGPIVGVGTFTPPDVTYPDNETGQSPKSVVHFTLGAFGIDIEADPATGEVVVNDVAAGYDIGKAISPINLRGQIEGGTIQGISAGLYEGMYYDAKGRLLTPDFTDYKIATAADVPTELHVFWEETPEELSPYGNRGIGEHSMIAPVPAINNALHQALGVRIHSYPMNRERVYRMIEASRKGVTDLWEDLYDKNRDYEQVKKDVK